MSRHPDASARPSPLPHASATRTSATRAHIAMIGAPIVSHVLPSLDIVRELVARGHRVTYANSERVADLITATGAEFVPFDSTLPVGDNIWPEGPIDTMELFLDDNMALLPQLRSMYDADPADLYLHDPGAYVARVLAERHDSPFATLSPCMVSWESYWEDSASALTQLPGWAAYKAKFTAWLDGCGTRTRDLREFSMFPKRAIATIPRVMQPHADRVSPERVSFVGPCFGERADQGGWTRPAEAKNVLLISLGSAYTRQPEFYRQCLAAYGDLEGWHVVLQIGDHVDVRELGEIPENFEVHSWAPQLAILKQADAFVTHAGMGGSNEGLSCGLPMIAVPQAADQPLNADLLVGLGVARRVDTADATAEALRTALLELTNDPEVARRSAALREEVRAEGGSTRAADLVEGLLA